MAEQKPLSQKILEHIARELKIPLKTLLATQALLTGGGTVPFIARYRKEATGNLDEVAIGAIEERTAYFGELEERRETILRTIGEQGKLTAELQKQVEEALDRSVLEDLYLPYKPKRRTKAMIARERGLEPLAQYLLQQQPAEVSLSEFAATFVNPEREVLSAEDALEGARHIVADLISETAEYRAHLRQMMLGEGLVVSKAAEGAKDPEGKFKMYFEYSEPAAKIPSHRMLAIRRGSNEEILYFQIELDPAKPIAYLSSKVLRRTGEWTPHLQASIEDAWRRLLNPSIQTEVRLELKLRSDTEAIRVFRENLQNLLLTAPAGQINVIGFDPGLRTGCKLAVVDDTGKFLAHDVIYPLEPKNDTAGAARKLFDLVEKFGVRAIAIGNGTGSREATAFVQDTLRSSNMTALFSVVVNESGASIYSASELARKEFPDLDLTVRGAISIARRLQDPLAELVKIDPKSIGVGQYQHDVDQKRLNEALEATVESCVNRVGVDLNTASLALLRHVAGLNDRTAQKIVDFRNENGRFRSRVQLKAVSGLGPKTFEQSAGFLRIRGGENPLDFTGVHPESYPIVQQMAESLGVSVSDLVSKPALADSLKIDRFQTESVGLYTLMDIQQELRKPGRDPRDEFVAPHFQEHVKTIADLTPGMVLAGAVTNVTSFGAFVDIGVHQDGLVHISELSPRFIKDPNEAVKVGQVVQVKVLSADAKAKRIALSIKALQASELPKVKHAPKSADRVDAKPASLSEQMTQLSQRFKSK